MNTLNLETMQCGAKDIEFSIKVQTGFSFIQQFPMGKFIHVFDETTDNKVLSFFHSFIQQCTIQRLMWVWQNTAE